MPKKILFTDVDGCIIIKNQPTDFLLVRKAIEDLSNYGFDIILSSAKTADEMILINQKLNLAGPFIVENGGGILFKKEIPTHFLSQKIFSHPPEYHLVSLIEGTIDIKFLGRYHLQERLLTKMSVSDISKKLSLSLEESACAKKRFFSQPLYIKDLPDKQIEKIKKVIKEHGYYYSKTHSFLHIQSSINHHKGTAINYLLQTLYPNEKIPTYAIGDGENDFSMLNTCEHAYFIMNLKIENLNPRWHKIKEQNFQGWQNAVQQILLAQH